MIKTPKRKIKIPTRQKDRPMIPVNNIIRTSEEPIYEPTPQKKKKRKKK